MKTLLLLLSFMVATAHASPRFVKASPATTPRYQTDTRALCDTARETRAYMKKEATLDRAVIHPGLLVPIPITRVEATLSFVCKHQNRMNDPAFVTRHFDFYRWYPDCAGVHTPNRPKDTIRMTRYYVHRAPARHQRTPQTPHALYGLPEDEAHLSLEAAAKHPELTRFQYGKQAILKGALQKKAVPVLAWVSREDLEAALLQGTLIADFDDNTTQTFNVHRGNDIPYNRALSPMEQERYWYFKAVDGVKGYGRDALHKITVAPGATFAADLEQFGLGKLLMVQYPGYSGPPVTRVGVLADTGGAFHRNFCQVDFLTGSYRGLAAFQKATRGLPDYVNAWIMVLKP